jgi:hypothetical protein
MKRTVMLEIFYLQIEVRNDDLNKIDYKDTPKMNEYAFCSKRSRL